MNLKQQKPENIYNCKASEYKMKKSNLNPMFVNFYLLKIQVKRKRERKKRHKKLPIMLTSWGIISWGRTRHWGAILWRFSKRKAGWGSSFITGFASLVEFFIAKRSSNQTMHNASRIYCAQYMKLFSSVLHQAIRIQHPGGWRPFLAESIDSAEGLPLLVQHAEPLQDDDIVHSNQI
jgi:hypothetical protein